MTGVLAYVLNLVMKRLSRRVRRMDDLSRSLLFLSIALLYSTLVQGFNMSTLFGAFVVGIVLSSYAGGSETHIMSGLRELGLLLYFSSVGMQITASISTDVWRVTLFSITYAFTGVFTQFLSLSIGALFAAVRLTL